MKIAHYCISTELGGAERSLLDLALGLKKTHPQFQLEFIFPKENGPLVDRLRQENFKIHILPLPQEILQVSRQKLLSHLPMALLGIPKLSIYTAQLVSLIKTNEYAVVHTTGLKCHILAALTARLIDSTVLWHIRDIFSHPVTKTFLKSLMKTPHLEVIYNSKASADPLNPDGQVIYNGFDEPNFEKPNHTFPIHQELGLDQSVPLVTHIGVIAQWKGQEQFIEMAKQVAKQNDKAHFLIVGDEIYDTSSDRGLKKRLIQKAEQLGLSARVHFLGFRTDTDKILQESQMLIHCSTSPEPFGRVIVEAMLNGLPVIAADAGGVPEIIENGKTGLLRNPKDINGYVKAILDLLEHPEKAQTLGDAALSCALENFSMKSYVSKVAGIYEMLRPF